MLIALLYSNAVDYTLSSDAVSVLAECALAVTQVVWALGVGSRFAG